MKPEPTGIPAGAATRTGTVNLEHAIGTARFGRVQLLVSVLCGATIVFDGYDLTIYGAALPPMIEEFGITPTAAGGIGSWALVGMMIGALAGGMLADRLGRRPVIVACVGVYSVATGAVLFADEPMHVAILRFIAGLGIGGVMPNAVALVAEYTPAKVRTAAVSVMFSGYMIGGIIASLLSMVLIPVFGWRSVYAVAAFPLLMVPLLLRYLPESPYFLLRSGQTDRLASIMRVIAPESCAREGMRFEHPDAQTPPRAVEGLFGEGRARGTLALWCGFGMVLLMVYGLLTWLPQLMVKAGYPLGSSLSLLMTLFLAGIVFTWVGGYLSDRVGGRRVLVTACLVAAVFIATLGFLGYTEMLWVYTAVALGGGATYSAQIFANALAAQHYPVRARSTGVGWALGVGRIGAILGPTMGGILLSANVSLELNFLAFAVPGLIAAACFALVPRTRTTPVTAESAH